MSKDKVFKIGDEVCWLDPDYGLEYGTIKLKQVDCAGASLVVEKDAHPNTCGITIIRSRLCGELCFKLTKRRRKKAQKLIEELHKEQRKQIRRAKEKTRTRALKILKETGES